MSGALICQDFPQVSVATGDTHRLYTRCVLRANNFRARADRNKTTRTSERTCGCISRAPELELVVILIGRLSEFLKQFVSGTVLV